MTPQNKVPRRHPAFWLYLATVALVVSIGQSVIQVLLTDGPSAIDLGHLRATFIGKVATNYPVLFWPASVLYAVAVIAGWVYWQRHQADLERTISNRPVPIPLRELDQATALKLGDDDATRFPYIAFPVVDQLKAVERLLSDATKGVGSKRGTVVFGEANSGKSRLEAVKDSTSTQ